jgi:hypothetical protein
MRVVYSNPKDHGLTMLEALVVVFSLFILVITLLASVSAPRLRTALGCVSQLKQTGQAFQAWEADHRGQFPMAVSVTNGGAMELVLRGDAAGVFQVLSNEFKSPKILVCPADKASRSAAGFRLAGTNVSYFVNADSPGSNHSLLAGDANLSIGGARVPAGRLEVPSNQAVLWFPGRHKWYGNVGLTDGSVTGLGNSDLTRSLRSGASCLLIP